MLWPLLVGMARARDSVLRGVTISATEALGLNLLAEVIGAGGDVVGRARVLATELASASPLAYGASKMTLNNWWRLSGLVSWDQALAYEAAALVLRSRDEPGWPDTGAP